NLYSAPPEMAAYSWSITGNASIVGETNLSTVYVNAGSCGEGFSLTLNLADTNGCVNTCTSDFRVEDNVLPSFSDFPPDAIVECPGDTSPLSTGTPVPVDNCGVQGLAFSDRAFDAGCSNKIVSVITR